MMVRADIPDDSSGRIQWIQNQLDRAEGPSRTWQYGWSTVHGGMTYLYTAQASTLDDDDENEDRHDAYVNAASFFVGFAAMMFDPLTTWKAAPQLRQLPETTEDEKQAKLRQAENLLRRCALREERGKSWTAHILAGLVNLAAGVAVACDGSRTGDGVAMFAGGMLLSEIQIFTQPTHASRAWKEYQTGASQDSARSYLENVSFSALPGGMAVNVRF